MDISLSNYINNIQLMMIEVDNENKKPRQVQYFNQKIKYGIVSLMYFCCRMIFQDICLNIQRVMWKHLERGSSPIDWCEDNYSYTPYVAEFINTVSNVLFFVMPPFLMILHRDYTRHCGRGINVIWCLLIVVGVKYVSWDCPYKTSSLFCLNTGILINFFILFNI